MKIKNIQKSAFLQNLVKAYQGNVYQDNALNRKLGRVGQPYPKGQQKEDIKEESNKEKKNSKSLSINIEEGIKLSKRQKEIVSNIINEASKINIPLELLSVKKKEDGSIFVDLDTDTMSTYYGITGGRGDRSNFKSDEEYQEAYDKNESLNRNSVDFIDNVLPAYNRKLIKKDILKKLNPNYKDFLKADGTVDVKVKTRGQTLKYSLDANEAKEALKTMLEDGKFIGGGGRYSVKMSDEIWHNIKNGNWDFTQEIKQNPFKS